jgi:hypothetical protein
MIKYTPIAGGAGANAVEQSVITEDMIFSTSIETRGLAEEYALATNEFRGWRNANIAIQPNNPGFDLFDNAMNVADITTTTSKSMNLSGLYKKLSNLAALPYVNNRTLQVYVPKFRYTDAEISELGTKLQQYITDFQLQNTSFRVTKIE